MDELRASERKIAEGLIDDQDLMNNAFKHAERLKNQSFDLLNNLADTKAFAKTALNAASRYAEIASAIMDAYNAAKMSNETADKANKEVSVDWSIITS